MFGPKVKPAHKLNRGDQIVSQSGRVLGTVDKVDTKVEGEGKDKVIRNTVSYANGKSFPINSDNVCTDEVYVK